MNRIQMKKSLSGSLFVVDWRVIKRYVVNQHHVKLSVELQVYNRQSEKLLGPMKYTQDLKMSTKAEDSKMAKPNQQTCRTESKTQLG